MGEVRAIAMVAATVAVTAVEIVMVVVVMIVDHLQITCATVNVRRTNAKAVMVDRTCHPLRPMEDSHLAMAVVRYLHRLAMSLHLTRLHLPKGKTRHVTDRGHFFSLSSSTVHTILPFKKEEWERCIQHRTKKVGGRLGDLPPGH